jgi:glycogen operon protein
MLLLRSKAELTRGAGDISLNEILRQSEIEWHGVKLGCPDWSDQSHSLALTASTLDGRFLIHFIANAYWKPLVFELPPARAMHQGWHRLVDTFLEPPYDICDAPAALPISDDTYRVEPRATPLAG